MSFRKIFVLLTAVSLMTVTVGCAKETNIPEYSSGTPHLSVSSMAVASNSNYELSWDNEEKFLSLKSLNSDQVWATIPYEYYLSGGSNSNLLSPLNLTVVDTTSLTWSVINGYTECVSMNNVKSARVENGIKVTYYFENYEISVPVVYTLTEQGIKITLDPKEICEGEQYWLVSVSLAPYLCSADNTAEDSYVFVPSGTGALLNVQSDARGTRKFSCEVYGEDCSMVEISNLTDDEAARIPVFGIKNGENAIVGIIEEGAESITVETEVGNSRTGYSGVWATANVRGSDVYLSTTATLIENTVKRISAERSETTVSVCYYPLTGEDADYNGMAKCYRNYLENSGLLKITESDAGSYGVTVYGGVDIATNLLGIPINKTKALTTFSEAKEIIEELLSVSSLTPQVKLYGYGENGIDAGRVAGGYKFASVFGSDKERKLLDSYCAENNISLYYDFDLIRYNSSGKGFSYTFDAAKSATLHVAEFTNLLSPTREEADAKTVRLLKRAEVKTAAEKLNSFVTKKGISGVSLSSLSEYAYSDFNNTEYICKGNTASDVQEYIELLKGENRTVASNSNAYAACVADAVYEVPLTNGDYDALDKEIPFYQLVFCGSKPMFSTEINLSSNYKESVMKAVSSGTGLSFALIKNFDPENIQNQSGKFYAAVFENNIEEITETLSAYGEFYSKIAGVGIESYEFLTEGLSETVFENGVRVYANHTDGEIESPVGVLSGYGVSAVLS